MYLLCLCITGAQHCNIGFGEPPLNPTEFSQPPVLLLLQNCDHIISGEVEMVVRLCSPRAQSLSSNISHHLQTCSKCHCIPLQGRCTLHKHNVVIQGILHTWPWLEEAEPVAWVGVKAEFSRDPLGPSLSLLVKKVFKKIPHVLLSCSTRFWNETVHHYEIFHTKSLYELIVIQLVLFFGVNFFCL